jgi:hypothetical protein
MGGPEYHQLPNLLRKVAGRILHVTNRVVKVALCLIDLSFRLKLLVAGNLASGLLDGALCLIGSAADMFAIHFSLLIG